MKKTKIIISILSTIGGIIPFISFGQTQEPCVTCGSSPTNLSLIMSFTTEILSNIKTIGTATPYVGKHVPPSRFDTGKFVPPKQGIMTKSLRRAKETLGSFLAIKRIHLEWGDAINIGDSISILSRNHVIIRDYQKLTKLEQDINRKKYELSVGGGRTDTINGVTLDKINAIIKRYKDLGIVTNSTKITNSSEYGDLILVLGKLNASLKHVVSLGGVSKGDNTEEKVSFDLRTSGRVALKIESKAINQIKSDYYCTRRYACEQSWTNIKEERKKIIESFKNGLGTAKEQITIANDNLKKAYSQENLKKTFVSENTLVNQISGTLNNVKNRRKRFIEEIKDSATIDLAKNIGENIGDQIENRNSEKAEILSSPITVNTVDKATIIHNFETRIRNTEQKIKDEANNTRNKYETLQISDIMAHFVAIFQKINGINNNIIGSKDKDNCLIKNLGAFCEKQCSNIGNKSCYY